MANELKIHHTVYNRGRDLIKGEPLVDDTKAMKSLLSDADTDLTRSKGGFFFDVVGDVFVIGFVTPKANRDRDILFNIFETHPDVARLYDLVELRDFLGQYCTRVSKSSIEETLVNPLNESMRATPDRYEPNESISTITVLWDRLRRDETPVIATLRQVSYFITKVHGTVGEFNFVAGVESTASRFDIQQGEPSSPNPDEVRQLYHYLQDLDETQGKIRYEDLPTVEGQYRRILEMQMEQEIEVLREELGAHNEIKRQFEEFFEGEVEARLNEQLEQFLELHKAKLDPDRDVRDELSNGSRLDDLLGRAPANEADRVKEELHAETDRLATEIHTAWKEMMLDQLEDSLDRRVEEMLARSEERTAEFQQLEAYENYDQL